MSDGAPACPQCGLPIKRGQGRTPQRIPDPPRISLTSLDIAKSIIGRVGLAAGFFASGVAWEAPPVIILSLVLGVSGVPLWFKARKAERLGGASDKDVIEQRVGRALIEAEDRDMQQIVDIEHNAGRIVDIEERLDFMERLLAKHRDEQQEKLGPGG